MPEDKTKQGYIVCISLSLWHGLCVGGGTVWCSGYIWEHIWKNSDDFIKSETFFIYVVPHLAPNELAINLAE